MSMRFPLVIGIAIVVSACGNNSPSTPVTPTKTPTGLSITPNTDLITIKGIETFKSTQTYTDGTSEIVTATWNSSVPDVATIESSTGLTNGIGAGQTSITAQYQGRTATQALRVVPNYHGRWQGDWAVATCTSDGDWLRANICASAYPTGSLWMITLDATQSRDAITGMIDFGDNSPGAVSGAIAMDGHLTVGGTYTLTVDGLSVEVTVSNCETNSTDNQRMTGHFRLTLRAAGMQGAVTVDGDLRICSKGAASPANALGVAHVLGRVRGGR